MPKKSRNNNKRMPKTRAAAQNLMRIARPLIKQAIIHNSAKMGRKVARRIGQPAHKGGDIGRRLGGHIAKIIGSGDYVIGGSSSVNSIMKGGIPVTARFGERMTRFRHREYIGDLSTSATLGGFQNTQYAINPSLFSTFPYLAQIAVLFEQYKFHGLVFEFVSTCSPYLSTSAMGAVIMSSQMNTQAPPPISKTQMENAEEALSGRMDQSLLYGVECATQVQNWYYTRHVGAGPNTSTGLANMYDLADFNIATSGGTVPASTNIGELWVTYDIEFQGPRLGDIRPGYFFCAGNAGIDKDNLFGTAWSATKSHGALNDAYLTSNKITLAGLVPGDVILILYSVTGTTASTAGWSVSPVTVGLASTNLYKPAGSSQNYITDGSVGTTQQILYSYNVTAQNPTITLTASAASGLPTSNVTSQVTVTTIGFGAAGRYFGDSAAT